MPVMLSIDCGLTVCKAALFDEHGHKYGESGKPTPLEGWRIDAEELWKRVACCIRQAVEQSGISAEEIAGIGLSGHGNGLYALDDNGKCFLAVSSMFDLNQTDVDAFRGSEPGKISCERTRQSCWGGQPVQILRWLKTNRREDYRHIRKVLFCKDYLRYRLTGEKATDYSDFYTGALCNEVDYFEIVDVPEMFSALPAPERCDRISGTVSPLVSAETGLPAGIPVACGGIDLFCCMQGAGICKSGTASITMGTWGITESYTDCITDRMPLTQVCCFLNDFPDVAIVSGPNSCVNLEWFIRNVRPELDYDQANSVAASFRPGEVKLQYLPYLYRDMFRPRITGGFVKISAGDTWREMIRAVYEGVCFAHRLQWERLCRAGVENRTAILTGGATNSPTWCGMLADVLKIPIEIPEEKQAGLLGAAMMAATGVGIYPDLKAAAGNMTRTERIFLPDISPAWEDRYEEFKEMVGN